MNKTLLISILIIVALVTIILFLGYQIYAPKTGYDTYKTPSSLNVFEGKITNMKVNPGKLEGVSAYDRNCVGDPLTECDAGVKTTQYGTLNFHYKHNMAIQPCIHMFGSEKLTVDILDSNGNARVTRMQDFSDMAGHHG